jgi:hypothetical protein
MTEATVKTKPPLFDFSTPDQVQRAYLVLFGLFIMFPAAFMGFLLTGIYVSPGMAISGGLGAVMFVGGVLGFFMVIIQRAVQQVQIKVVQEK